MTKIMIVGASGVLGKLICQELLRVFNNNISLVVCDYKMDRGKNIAASLGEHASFCYMDINNQENIKQAIQNIDIVIVAIKQQNPDIQAVCIQNKVLCIDVTVYLEFVNNTKRLSQNAYHNNVGSIVMWDSFLDYQV